MPPPAHRSGTIAPTAPARPPANRPPRSGWIGTGRPPSRTRRALAACAVACGLPWGDAAAAQASVDAHAEGRRAIGASEAAGDAAWERGWATVARQSWTRALEAATGEGWSAAVLRLRQRLLAADRLDAEAIVGPTDETAAAAAAWPADPARGPMVGWSAPIDRRLRRADVRATEPVVARGLLLWNDGAAVHARELAGGRPPWTAHHDDWPDADDVLFPRGAAGRINEGGNRSGRGSGGICCAAGRCFATLDGGRGRAEGAPMLACLDLSDAAEGRLVWAAAPPDPGGSSADGRTAVEFDGPPVADFELCIVVVRGRDPRGLLAVAAFDARDGSLRWVRPLGPSVAADGIDHARGSRLACLAEDTIVVATHAGVVVALRRDGREAWRHATAKRATRAEAGREAVTVDAAGSPPAAACFSRGRIVVAPRDRGGVVALDSRDGRPIWAAEGGRADIVGSTDRHLVVRMAGEPAGGIPSAASLRLLAPEDGSEWARRDAAAERPAGHGLVAGRVLFWPTLGGESSAGAERVAIHRLDAGSLRPLAPPLGLPPDAMPDGTARDGAAATVGLAVGSGCLVVTDGRWVRCLGGGGPAATAPRAPDSH